jgi:hypothetical protein
MAEAARFAEWGRHQPTSTEPAHQFRGRVIARCECGWRSDPVFEEVAEEAWKAHLKKISQELWGQSGGPPST